MVQFSCRGMRKQHVVAAPAKQCNSVEGQVLICSTCGEADLAFLGCAVLLLIYLGRRCMREQHVVPTPADHQQITHH
jgi:hypothetical protein